MSVNSQPFRRSAAAVAAPRWLALLAAVTAVLLSSLTAASSARAEDSAGQSRTQQIVAALRENPVYVDPAYRTAVPPARQKALTARIERTGLPIFVDNDANVAALAEQLYGAARGATGQYEHVVMLSRGFWMATHGASCAGKLSPQRWCRPNVTSAAEQSETW